MASTPERISLASASPTRARLLEAAGVAFAVEPAAIDESPIKHEMRLAGRPAIECAQALARAKAATVSARHPDALVIGADQLLAAGDEWHDKPNTLAEARLKLQTLRGRTHVLATALCVLRDSERLWQAASLPELTMREFSEAFLENYIAAEGEAILGSVGAYRLHNPGGRRFFLVAGVRS